MLNPRTFLSFLRYLKEIIYEVLIELSLKSGERCTDNRYWPIIGRFADNRHRLVSTLLLADYCLHNW